VATHAGSGRHHVSEEEMIQIAKDGPAIRALWAVIDGLRRKIGMTDDAVEMVVDSMIDYYHSEEADD